MQHAHRLGEGGGVSSPRNTTCARVRWLEKRRTDENNHRWDPFSRQRHVGRRASGRYSKRRNPRRAGRVRSKKKPPRIHSKTRQDIWVHGNWYGWNIRTLPFPPRREKKETSKGFNTRVLNTCEKGRKRGKEKRECGSSRCGPGRLSQRAIVVGKRPERPRMKRKIPYPRRTLQFLHPGTFIPQLLTSSRIFSHPPRRTADRLMNRTARSDTRHNPLHLVIERL